MAHMDLRLAPASGAQSVSLGPMKGMRCEHLRLGVVGTGKSCVMNIIHIIPYSHYYWVGGPLNVDP